MDFQRKLRRPNHIGCRLSDEEMEIVSNAAAKANLPLGDWLRRTILASTKDERRDIAQAVLLEEVLFTQMLLSNALPKILTGIVLSEEETDKLMQTFNLVKSAVAKQTLDAAERRNTSER